MIFVWEKVIVTPQFQIFDWKSHAFRFLIEFQTLLSNFDWDGHTYDFSKKRIRSENQMKNGMKKSHCVTAPLSRTLLFHILKLKLINSNTLVPKKKNSSIHYNETFVEVSSLKHPHSTYTCTIYRYFNRLKDTTKW